MSNLEFYEGKAGFSPSSTNQRNRTGFSIYRSFFKRVFDIFLVILLLPIVLPLIAIMWALVSLDGGGGFYSQRRVGRGGREFRFWKIRTMAPNAKTLLQKHLETDPIAAAEWREAQKLRDDPRITKLGRFLRATSLDELPQIYNVVKGDMSFVGPRPFMPEQAELYGPAEAYHSLRPGITGLWQVRSRNRGSFRDRVQFDETYSTSLSFGSDLSILARTAGQVFHADGC